MDHYQLIEIINRGSFGDIWLVKCIKTKKQHVVKQLDLHQLTKREQKTTFFEAKYFASLQHPNIAQYLDAFFNCERSLFIVMEHYDYGDLSSYIQRRKGRHFEEQRILEWFVQICMALKYLHSKSILHRDLKTESIFLTKNKLVKVGDIGLSQVFKDASFVHYASPEILNGHSFTHHSDIFSFGCCIYEIISLKQNIDVLGLQSLIQNVLKENVTSPHCNVSKDLLGVLLSTLAPEPEKRPSAADLLRYKYVKKYMLNFIQHSKHNTSKTGKSTSKQCETLKSTNQESIVTETKIKNRTGEITKLPDSNGNGDGNDNSQLRDMENDCTHSDQENVTDDIKVARKNSAQSQDTAPNQRGILIPQNTPQNILTIKHSEYFRNNAERLRSQNCYNFLTDLTHVIKNSRFRSWESLSEAAKLASKTGHYYGPAPPKSAEELLMIHSRRALAISERNVRSAVDDYDRKFRNNDMCSLPLISQEMGKHVTRNARNKLLNLPFIPESERIASPIQES